MGGSTARRRRGGLTAAELRALPAMVDLATAGRAYNIGRTKAHELARTGRFPVPVRRVGGQYRVRTTDVLRDLGIEPEQVAATCV